VQDYTEASEGATIQPPL